MKIITWNIRHGGGTRISKIADVIKNHDADIIVITEYRNNENGSELRKSLLENGYLFQNTPLVDRNKNTLMIAAKNDFSTKFFYDNLQEEYFRALKVENSSLCLYGLYFPQKLEKKKIFEFILSEMSKNEHRAVIFMGDFNTGKHYIDEEKNTFSCSQYMDSIEQHSYVDVWRYINKDKREFTWYSNIGNGFRIDHAYINEKYKIKIVNCFYSHNERLDKVSDHSMMVLELDL